MQSEAQGSSLERSKSRSRRRGKTRGFVVLVFVVGLLLAGGLFFVGRAALGPVGSIGATRLSDQEVAASWSKHRSDYDQLRQAFVANRALESIDAQYAEAVTSDGKRLSNADETRLISLMEQAGIHVMARRPDGAILFTLASIETDTAAVNQGVAVTSEPPAPLTGGDTEKAAAASGAGAAYHSLGGDWYIFYSRD